MTENVSQSYRRPKSVEQNQYKPMLGLLSLNGVIVWTSYLIRKQVEVEPCEDSANNEKRIVHI